MSSKAIAFIWILSIALCSKAEHVVQLVDQNGVAVADAVIALDEQEEQKNIDAPVIIDQINRQFEPQTVLVNKGQRVVFPNSDDVRHHVYSFSRPNDFEVRLYGRDQKANVVMEHAGIVVLGCNIHDRMQGHIYVNDDRVAKLTDKNGEAVFREEVRGTYMVWHKRLSTSQTEQVQVTPVKQFENRVVLKVDLLPVPVTSKFRKFKNR